MAKVYKGIWNVVNETSALVIVLHHSGWDEKRERGSSTIRQKSDIVVKIVSFDPETGTVRLKRRSGAGPKLTEFCLEARLVTLDNYPELIPIVTGPKEDKVPTTHTADADERNGRKLVQVTATHFPQGATWSQLRDKSEMKPSTYKRALACALRKAWLTKDDNHYNLNSAESQAKDLNSDLGPALGPRVHSYRSVDPLDPITARSSEPNWTQIGPLDPNTSCKNMNTTSHDKKPNKINKAENSPPIAPLAIESGVHYDELEAFAVALEQLSGRPSRSGAR